MLARSVCAASASSLLLAAPCGSRCASTTPLLLKGHSHWQNIRATKEKFDTQRSKAINSLLTKMKTAVKHGFDTKLNKALANVEAEFLKQGLGLDAYKKTLQRLKERPDLPFDFAVIGPGGSFFVIHMEGPSRAVTENTLRKYVNKTGGGFRVAPDLGAIRAWFEEKGVVVVEDVDVNKKAWSAEQMEELAIELECEEVARLEDEGGKFELLCEPLAVAKLEAALNRRELVVESAGTEFRALHPVALSADDREKVDKFYALLHDEEMVADIFDNLQEA